ncbi:MAG TPA: hypothetical protein PKD59_04050 [Miltoncostaeaceae bacterium]|nr:hypothetical protein [Miltoncostaeaceae bacterium]
MRTFLPPEDPGRRRELGAVSGVSGTGAVAGGDAGPAPDADHRLVRTATMTAADARAHMATWEGEAASRPVAAPPGVVARERRRSDRVHPGGVRLQRLAVAVHGDTAAVAHWSVSEPADAADERVWQRVLARVSQPPDPGGWTA